MESIGFRLNEYDANVVLANIAGRLRGSALRDILVSSVDTNGGSLTSELLAAAVAFELGKPFTVAGQVDVPLAEGLPPLTLLFLFGGEVLPPQLSFSALPTGAGSQELELRLPFERALLEIAVGDPSVFPLAGSVIARARGLFLLSSGGGGGSPPQLRIEQPRISVELTSASRAVFEATRTTQFTNAVLDGLNAELSRQLLGTYPSPPSVDIQLPDTLPVAQGACSLPPDLQSPLLFHAIQAWAGSPVDPGDPLSDALEIRLDSVCAESPMGGARTGRGAERLSSFFVQHEFVQSLVCWAVGSMADPPAGVPGGAGSQFEAPGQLAPGESLDVTATLASAAAGSGGGQDVQGAIELIDLLDALEQAAGPDLWPVGAPDGPPDYTAVPPEWVPLLDTMLFEAPSGEQTYHLLVHASQTWWSGIPLEAARLLVEDRDAGVAAVEAALPDKEEPVGFVLTEILQRLGMTGEDMAWPELAPAERAAVVGWLVTGAGPTLLGSLGFLWSWLGLHACISLRQLLAVARRVAVEADDPHVTPLRALAALLTPYFRKRLRKGDGSGEDVDIERAELSGFSVDPAPEERAYRIRATLEAEGSAHLLGMTVGFRLKRVKVTLAARLPEALEPDDEEPACWRPIELDVEHLHVGQLVLPWWAELVTFPIRDVIRERVVMPLIQEAVADLTEEVDKLFGDSDVQELRYDLLPAIRGFRFGTSGLEVVTRLTDLTTTNLAEDLTAGLLRDSVRVASTGTRLLGPGEGELDLDAECIERGLPEAPDLTWRPGSEGPVVEFARSGAMDVLLA
ncbi:MAG: hypothetical protein ACQEXJ_24080, partial [Myxococcota bacterium]